MRWIQTIALVLVFLVSSIPGLLWQLFSQLFGWKFFGELIPEPLSISLWKSIPSTLIAWIIAFIVFRRLSLFLKRTGSSRITRSVALGASVLLASSVGFTFNWLFAEVIQIYNSWTTLEYLDLLGGSVIMVLWSAPPSIAAGAIAFTASYFIQKH